MVYKRRNLFNLTIISLIEGIFLWFLSAGPLRAENTTYIYDKDYNIIEYRIERDDGTIEILDKDSNLIGFIIKQNDQTLHLDKSGKVTSYTIPQGKQTVYLDKDQKIVSFAVDQKDKTVYLDRNNRVTGIVLKKWEKEKDQKGKTIKKLKHIYLDRHNKTVAISISEANKTAYFSPQGKLTGYVEKFKGKSVFKSGGKIVGIVKYKGNPVTRIEKIVEEKVIKEGLEGVIKTFEKQPRVIKYPVSQKMLKLLKEEKIFEGEAMVKEPIKPIVPKSIKVNAYGDIQMREMRKLIMEIMEER